MRCGSAPGFAEHRSAPVPAGRERRREHRRDPSALRRHPRRARRPRQQLAVDQLHDGAQRRVVARATSCSSATRRTPRTSRSAPGPSSPWRMRSRSPRACTSIASVAGALAAYEAERKPVVVSTQRAAQASLEWFENLGQYVHQDPLQFAFNILTRSRRVTYDNLRLRDPEFVAEVDAWFDAGVRHQVGQHARARCAADVPALPPARARVEESRDRLGDGHVLRDRRHAERLSPREHREQGARRRGAGDDRDGLRVTRGTHHAGLRRHVQRRARGGLAACRRVRARAHAARISVCSSGTRAARDRRS